MAGLFGMFNYAKEGPGVAKNAPKKRAFFAFMEIYGRKFWKLAIAGLLWAVTALPIVTRGWADAGLTFITRNFSREKHAFLKEDFVETIKKNHKHALTIGIINTVVTGIFIFNLIFTLRHVFPGVMLLFGWTPEQVASLGELDTLGLILMALSLVGYITFTWMKYYIPFLMITFKLSVKQVYKNAFLFAGANMKVNLLISAILIAVYGVLAAVLLLFPYAMVAVVVILLCLSIVPAFRSFLIQYCIFPAIKRLIIDPYYEANPNADKQARRDLGLDVEEETKSTEESVETDAKEEAAVEEEVIFTDTLPQEEENVPKKSLPKQYNEKELRHFNRQVQRRVSDEDDDTI